MNKKTAMKKKGTRFYGTRMVSRLDAYSEWWYSRPHPYGRGLRRKSMDKLYYKIARRINNEY